MRNGGLSKIDIVEQWSQFFVISVFPPLTLSISQILGNSFTLGNVHQTGTSLCNAHCLMEQGMTSRE
jgi:hypothetical protein